MSSQVRVRLQFDTLLCLGELERSWLLIPSNLHNIGDLSSHLLSTFTLRKRGPAGLILKLEGHVLPPSQPIAVLRENDLLCIERRPTSHIVLSAVPMDSQAKAKSAFTGSDETAITPGATAADKARTPVASSGKRRRAATDSTPPKRAARTLSAGKKREGAGDSDSASVQPRKRCAVFVRYAPNAPHTLSHRVCADRRATSSSHGRRKVEIHRKLATGSQA